MTPSRALVFGLLVACSPQEHDDPPSPHGPTPDEWPRVPDTPACHNGVPEIGELCLEPTGAIARDGGGRSVAVGAGEAGPVLGVLWPQAVELWQVEDVDAVFLSSKAALEGDAHAVAMADMDGDGRADAVAATDQGIATLVAAATQPQLSSGFDAGPALALGDIDGDAALDAVTIDFASERARLHAGDGVAFGDGVLLDQFTGTSVDVAIDDYDGDGHPDIAALTSYWHYIVIQFGDGLGGLSTPVFEDTIGVVDNPTALGAGDLDNDGDLDFVVSAMGSYASVALRGADGSYANDSFVAQGEDAVALAVADLDRDGVLDFVTANEASHDVTIQFGLGDGKFLAPYSLPAIGVPRDIAVSDFDSDGQQDIAIASDAGIELWLSSP